MNVLKCDFGDIDEAMIHDVKRPYEYIFCTLSFKSSDSDEFSQVMFYVGEWTWEYTICLTNVLKNDFGEVDEATFQSVERQHKLIFYILGIEKID
jgi:hypothetical protein